MNFCGAMIDPGLHEHYWSSNHNRLAVDTVDTSTQPRESVWKGGLRLEGLELAYACQSKTACFKKAMPLLTV